MADASWEYRAALVRRLFNTWMMRRPSAMTRGSSGERSMRRLFLPPPLWNLTGGAMSGGWGEIDGAPEWLSMVVQAHRDADSRFGAAHVVAEIEVVENILDDLRVELLRLHCGVAVEDVGRVEDVLGREVEPEVEPDGHRNGHDEDDGESRLRWSEGCR